MVVLVAFTILRPIEAGDAHAYWSVDLADPYTRPVATQDAFTYPPPAALFFAVLGALPFEVFQAIWTLVIGLALLLLTGPWALLFILIPVVASDLYLGNIHVLLAASIVASLRWPALWAIPLLTKPSCGIGLLWYLARGEWRRLAVAWIVPAVMGRRKVAEFDWPTGTFPSGRTACAVAYEVTLSAIRLRMPPWTRPAGCCTIGATGTDARTSSSPTSS